MSSEIGVLSFTYIPLNTIGALEGIFSSNDSDRLKEVHDRYVLISNDEKNKFHHDCPMLDFLKKDIDNCGSDRIKAFYEYFVEKYSKEVVDLLIVEDEKIIQDKILFILNFAMNDVYKSNSIRVEFLRYNQHQDLPSSIPDLIYSTILENFDIKDQYLLGQQNYIVITRRK